MLLKFKTAATQHHVPVSNVWSTIVAHVRARRQRACDRRILSHMNGHNLRDLGLSRPRQDWPR